MPKAWVELYLLDGKDLNSQTNAFLFEWLGNVLMACTRVVGSDKARNETLPEPEPSPSPDPVISKDKEPIDWTWKAPNLFPGGDWYHERILSLADACKGLPRWEHWFKEGL